MFKTTEVKVFAPPGARRALDVLFILHADHEQNCSTSGCAHRVLTSGSLFLHGGCGGPPLYGPLHGGANEEVLRMAARDRVDRRDSGVHPARQERRSPVDGLRAPRLQELRPRAKIIKQIAGTGIRRDRQEHPLIDLALELERIRCLQEEYFVSRKLYPNVDSIRASFTRR